MLKHCVVVLLLSASVAAQCNLQIDEKPKVTLEQALPLARQAALAKAPDLDKFILHSVKPSGLLCDAKGKYWRFVWQELPGKTDLRALIVQVTYSVDGTPSVQPASMFPGHIDENPRVTLEQALPIARQAALAKAPDLDKFVLHSVQPQGSGDSKVKQWRFQWQELPVKTGMRGLIVRVDRNDGSTEVVSYTQ